MNRSHWTLCANPALARALRTRHAIARKAAGDVVWEAPNVADLDSWIARQWAASWPAEQLLSGAQELALWQGLIDAAPEAADLISSRSLARQARAAARLIAQYQIDTTKLVTWTPEQAAFLRWHTAFQAQLDAQGWVTAAQVPALLLPRLCDSGVERPARISLHGFVHPPTPASQSVLGALAAGGCEIVRQPQSDTDAQINSATLADDDAVWGWLGEQVAERLAVAADAEAPAPDIVIACANPAEHAQAIAAHFAPRVAPWQTDPAYGPRTQPWRTEPASPLADNPLVAAALAVLAVERWRNPFVNISRVLLCGALWRGEDRLAAAKLEAKLRDKAVPAVHLSDCLHWAPERLQPRMQAWMNAIERAPQRATPGAWAAQFDDQLRAIGWPGELARESHAFQAAQALREALAGLAGLDAQLGRVSFSSASSWLCELLRSKPWAPRAEHLQPVLITSFEEAACLPADLRYVLDTGDDAWPPIPLRMPLIASEALAAAGVPQMTPASSLARAQRTAEALLSDAKAICAVLGGTDANGSARVPATIWPSRFDWAAAAPGPTAHSRAEQTIPTSDAVPPIAEPQSEGVRGGTRIFESWVAAPLYAFVRHRLGVETLDEAPNGLSTLTQGGVIHAVLDGFWADVEHAAGLAALTADEVEARLHDLVTEQLETAMEASRHPPLLRQAEAARITDVVARWLAHERRRGESFEVLAREQRVEFSFEGLALRLQLDRVDRVQTADGPRHVVLDYKTGKDVHPGGWFADRITQPQLPLYATPPALEAAQIPAVDGIGFAHVHWRRPALAAATNWTTRLIDTDKASRCKPAAFDDDLADAQARLQAAAQGFLAGDISFVRKHAKAHPLAVLLPPEPAP